MAKPVRPEAGTTQGLSEASLPGKPMGTLFADSIRASSPKAAAPKAEQTTAPDQHARSADCACIKGAIHRRPSSFGQTCLARASVLQAGLCATFRIDVLNQPIVSAFPGTLLEPCQHPAGLLTARVKRRRVWKRRLRRRKIKKSCVSLRLSKAIQPQVAGQPVGSRPVCRC